MFPLLDLLRAFAALTVLVYHQIAHWEWSAFPQSGPLAWFRAGWMAVDLFFVISGFVIGLSAFGRAQAGSGFRGGFLRARLARIVPLHWLTLAAFIVAVEPALLRQADIAWNLGAHILFLHNLVPAWSGSINGPNWSLGVEMQFYLLMALAAPWLARMRPSRLLLGALAIAWAWRAGAWFATIPGPLDRAYFLQAQLPGMLDEFALGLLLARFVRSKTGIAVLARLATQSRLRWGPAALVALCWYGAFQLYLAHDFWQVGAMATFFRTLLGACAALTVLLLCGWPAASAGAATRVALYLGKISYGIYLWHVPVLFFHGAHTQLDPLAALLVALPATIGLAAIGWHLVEAPALARWGRRRAAPPAAAARVARGAPAA
ncbi:MAG TPA: acyltransferase [Ramlibacter sp.]